MRPETSCGPGRPVVERWDHLPCCSEHPQGWRPQRSVNKHDSERRALIRTYRKRLSQQGQRRISDHSDEPGRPSDTPRRLVPDSPLASAMLLLHTVAPRRRVSEQCRHDLPDCSILFGGLILADALRWAAESKRRMATAATARQRE